MIFLKKWGVIASLGFILLVPFPFFLFGFWSDFTRGIFDPICQAIFNGLNPRGEYFGIDSDSAGMWIQFLLIISVSAIIAMVWKVKGNAIFELVLKWHRTIIAYFLGFMLLKYGVDKLLLNQFYFPEPNTLYTRVGAMDKSLLYWTSMGTSKSYSIFMGCVEIIPGIMLLFRRTRALAGLISVLIFANVFMVNIGFNIDVKLLSLVLLIFSIYVAFPFIILIKTVIKTPNEFTRIPFSSRLIKNYSIYSGLKIGIVFIFLLECFSPFLLRSSNTDLDELKGTYLVEFYGSYFEQEPKYVHFHSKGYLIVEYHNDFMEDFSLKINETNMELERHEELLNFNYFQSADNLVLISADSTAEVFIKGRRMKNERLPLANDKIDLVAY